jgi:hypothetical protein
MYNQVEHDFGGEVKPLFNGNIPGWRKRDCFLPLVRASRSYPLTLVNNDSIRSLNRTNLAQNEYDELGQLIRKSVGGTYISGQASLQKIDYSYNIRGWLVSINDVEELNPASDPTDLFSFKISYSQIENNVGGNIKPRSPKSP